MIAKQDEMKADRRNARTIEEIKAYAAKYSIRISGTDQEIMERFKSIPVWE